MAEGPFGLPVPKSVELTDALIKVLLDFMGRGGDGEVNVTGGSHQVGGLARPFVKGLSVGGMPRQ